MARSQYSLPAESKPDRNDPRGLTGYIRETAQKYGIDPEVALRVAKSEGLRSFKSGVVQKNGKEEPSWGAFQLYTGGGLGNQFKKDTGLDPSDPANEKATIDYALKTAAKTGWGPWHGAKNTGIGEYEGISGGGAKTAAADPAAGYGGIGSDAAASERAATAVKGTQTDTSSPEVAQAPPAAPTGGFIDKLQDPKTGAMTGLDEAIKGLGQATASTGLNTNMYATPTPAPVPVAMPSAPRMTPMVDPQMADRQRQQLAVALQRLNSGKLV
jgi:hypothetical protein